MSHSSDKYYVGQTEDVEKRLERHNKNIVPATKGRGPWELKYEFELESRSQAMILERKIKKRGAKRYLETLGM